MMPLLWAALVAAAQTPARPPAPDRVAAELGRVMDSLVRADEFSGVVLLARHDEPVFFEAFGYASQAYEVPNRPDTKFNIGSINKLFTRVAILQLVEQGKLALDDPIARHLPDYPRPAGDQVSIRHLLDHAGGLGDIFGPEYFAAAKDRFRAPRDFFPLFQDRPLLFQPGSGRRYSNAGYLVLGAIVEAASGSSYYDYVREHVYRPAGMTDTDHFDWRVPVRNRAVGYTRVGPEGPLSERREHLIGLAPRGGASAGGGLSTARDLLRFVIALREGKLLNSENTRRVWQGGDWAVAGGSPGCNAVVEVLVPFGGYMLVALANYDPPVAERIGRRVRALLGAPVD